MRLRSVQLLKQAAALYDDESTRLKSLSQSAHGFKSGAVWMSKALGVIRNREVTFADPDTNFFLLGFIKYLLATLAALLAIGLLIVLHAPWILALIAGGLAFYAVEVQFVFLFPVAIDGSGNPWQASFLMTRQIGTIPAMSIVIPLAVVMLAGGLCGQGFVRSWCLGCLSVILWYESQRSA